MSPTRVHIFTDTSGYGGAEKSLLALLEGLDRRRWRPTLVYHDSPRVAPMLRAARTLGTELWAVPPMPEGLAGATRIPRFAAALRARRPAVFHAHLNSQASCKFGLVAAVLARVPAVVATQHFFLESPLSFSGYVQQRALGAAVGRYIAVSGYVQQGLHETFRWPLSKIVVVPNGIDASRLRCEPDAALRAILSHDGTRPVVLTTARLVPAKGLVCLLEAVRTLPQVHVVIAGDGPQRDELMTRARDLGLADRVDFLGQRDDVPQLLACSDIVASPSFNEGFPLAVLEAMAAEKPIVATRVGGTREAIVDGHSGLLIPPGDPAALAAAVGRLLNDPSLAARLARAARARVEESFSSTRMVEQVTDVYEELLLRSSPCAAPRTS
jgi:glycosyltransferase involved in cell wall biosynthesis